MTKYFMILLVCILVACGASPKPNDQAVTVWTYNENAVLDRLVSDQIKIEQKRGTPKQVANCLKRRDEFVRVAKMTEQSTELLVALATVESGGCKRLKNELGAEGIMQIHFPGTKHLTRAAALLGVEVDQLDYKHNSTHNLVLGAVRLQDYTYRYDGNVADGLEAYNQGPDKVERGPGAHSEFPKYVVRVLATAQLVNN